MMNSIRLPGEAMLLQLGSRGSAAAHFTKLMQSEFELLREHTDIGGITTMFLAWLCKEEFPPRSLTGQCWWNYFR